MDALPGATLILETVVFQLLGTVLLVAHVPAISLPITHPARENTLTIRASETGSYHKREKNAVQ